MTHNWGYDPPSLRKPVPTSVEKCADPVISTASSLLRMENDTSEPGKREVEKTLTAQAARIVENDLSALETMLACQAQMLHRIFAHSWDQYVAGGLADREKHLSQLALRSQNYCRLTVATLSGMKHLQALVAEQKNSRLGKMENELYNQPIPYNYNELYGKMDTGGEKKASNADAWLAAMDQSGR